MSRKLLRLSPLTSAFLLALAAFLVMPLGFAAGDEPELPGFAQAVQELDSLSDPFLQETDSAPYAVIDGTVARNLTKGEALDTSILSWNDRLAIAYSDGSPNKQIKFWYDDGAGGGIADDGQANGGEIRVIPEVFIRFEHSAVSIEVVNGFLAVAFAAAVYDPVFDDFGDLNVWYDDGLGAGGVAGDAQVNGSEIRTLTNEFFRGGEIEVVDGHMAVFWKEAAIGFQLWVDDGDGGGTADDGQINGTELRSPALHALGNIANGRSFTATGGPLAVTYWAEPISGEFNFYVWVDDGFGSGVAGNLIVDGAELRTPVRYQVQTTFWSDTTYVGTLLATSFKLVGGNQDLLLWLDDGTDNGTAFDNVPHPDEFRSIAFYNDVGDYSGIIQLNGRLGVIAQYLTAPRLTMFFDDGNDGAVPDDFLANGAGQYESPENRDIDTALGLGGYYSSVTSYDPDPGDPGVCSHVAVSHINTCNSCGYAEDLGLHLTTINFLAPRGLFINDGGDHQTHQPFTEVPDIDLTLRWFEDGADTGEVFIGGDVTGPNTGVWIPFTENVLAYPDNMTLPVSLTAGDGEKFVFMDFRSGVCNGDRTTRTITLGNPIEDPQNLNLALDGGGDLVLTWDPVGNPNLSGYNLYRATNLAIGPSGLPQSWGPLNQNPIPAGTETFLDTTADLIGGVELLYYYATSVDTFGTESTDPPTQ